jgi:hypothetical protein
MHLRLYHCGTQPSGHAHSRIIAAALHPHLLRTPCCQRHRRGGQSRNVQSQEHPAPEYRRPRDQPTMKRSRPSQSALTNAACAMARSWEARQHASATTPCIPGAATCQSCILLRTAPTCSGMGPNRAQYGPRPRPRKSIRAMFLIGCPLGGFCSISVRLHVCASPVLGTI